MSRACSKCGETKSDSEFPKDRTKASGFSSQCKTCKTSRNKEWYKKNRDKVSKKRSSPTGRKKSALNKRKQIKRKVTEDPNYCRRLSLKQKFNMTLEEYEMMLSKQENKCAICGISREEHKAKYKVDFSVDHCHTTGKIRGILCQACNTALGKFRDDTQLLQKAILYLID